MKRSQKAPSNNHTQKPNEIKKQQQQKENPSTKRQIEAAGTP